MNIIARCISLNEFSLCASKRGMVINMNSIFENSIFKDIKTVLELARHKAYNAVNFAMVEAYWSIGKIIIEAQNGNERAQYGEHLIKDLSAQLTLEFGKGFTVANLKNIRQFYLAFQNGYALRSELSWTH